MPNSAKWIDSSIDNNFFCAQGDLDDSASTASADEACDVLVGKKRGPKLTKDKIEPMKYVVLTDQDLKQAFVRIQDEIETLHVAHGGPIILGHRLVGTKWIQIKNNVLSEQSQQDIVKLHRQLFVGEIFNCALVVPRTHHSGTVRGKKMYPYLVE